MSVTLEDSAEKSILSNFGKLASSIECRFACGGTVISKSPLLISYKMKTGDWSSQPLQLPGTASLQNLLDSCFTASFGIGIKTVTDKTYRDALKLEPDCFNMNFNLADTTVLSDISRLMAVTTYIKAELYKLNVYSTGGHFKSHVDTPRSECMFGSLVVCLPSQFTGGELVTRHQGRQVTFNWSNSTSDIHWAAFYGNVEHEVLPVTSGHRITLTYNLYHLETTDNLVSFHVTTNPLYLELLGALRNPHFMRGGGTLGFYCQHKYIDISDNIEQSSCVLKGEDAILFKIATTLGLSFELKPVINQEFNTKTVFVPNKFKSFCRGVREYVYMENEEVMEDLFGEPFGKPVTWCQSSPLGIMDPAGAALVYGNDQTVDVFYKTIAILIEIPKFTSERAAIGQ